MDAQLKLARDRTQNRAKELDGKATISASEFDPEALHFQGADRLARPRSKLLRMRRR